MKKLRWYKVAKLMGEGATARNCHDRWRELVWPEKISDFDEVPILPVVGKVSDGWDDEEVRHIWLAFYPYCFLLHSSHHTFCITILSLLSYITNLPFNRSRS